MRFSKRRRTALSSCHGMLVAASTSTPSWSLPTPFICTRNSVFTRRALSLSCSLRAEHSESISSIKMMLGLFSRAISNSCRTSFSLSPSHLEMRSADDTAKNVESASVATALARYDLPVPGGPYNRMPFHGLRLPWNSCGNLMGKITASLSDSLAWCRPATSSHFTFGFSRTMAPPSASLRFAASSSSLLALPPAAPPPPDATGAAFCWSRESRNCFNFSARAMYSVVFCRIVALHLAFFSYLSAVMKYSSDSWYKRNASS
mmetsp:Transcript_13118/g.32402  ORF Transcript_13118/g.32402 Transcript_13118/m.32402 type:complete len:261 (-) Transcript_13118:190-972(-)